MEMEHDVRPWGEYWVLDEGKTFKVKRIQVNPGARLSYQYHYKRSEVWTIVKGTGRVTLNGKQQDLHPGEFIRIPKEAKHRIENPGDEACIFIEVQHGTYFGEDDIVRIEDDYNRE